MNHLLIWDRTSSLMAFSVGRTSLRVWHNHEPSLWRSGLFATMQIPRGRALTIRPRYPEPTVLIYDCIQLSSAWCKLCKQVATEWCCRYPVYDTTCIFRMALTGGELVVCRLGSVIILDAVPTSGFLHASLPSSLFHAMGLTRERRETNLRFRP